MTEQNQVFSADFKAELKSIYMENAVKAEAVAKADYEKICIVVSTYRASLIGKEIGAEESATLVTLGGKLIDLRTAHEQSVKHLQDVEANWKKFYLRLVETATNYVYQHIYYDWNTLPETVQLAIWNLIDRKNYEWCAKQGFSPELIQAYLDECAQHDYKTVVELMRVHMAQEDVKQKAEKEFLAKGISENMKQINSGISKAEEILKAAGLK